MQNNNSMIIKMTFFFLLFNVTFDSKEIIGFTKAKALSKSRKWIILLSRSYCIKIDCASGSGSSPIAAAIAGFGASRVLFEQWISVAIYIRFSLPPLPRHAQRNTTFHYYSNTEYSLHSWIREILCNYGLACVRNAQENYNFCIIITYGVYFWKKIYAALMR